MLETGTRLAETIAAARADDRQQHPPRPPASRWVLDLTLRGGATSWASWKKPGARVTETHRDARRKVADTFREAAETLEATINAKGDRRARDARIAAASRSRRCSRTAAPSLPTRFRATQLRSAA